MTQLPGYPSKSIGYYALPGYCVGLTANAPQAFDWFDSAFGDFRVAGPADRVASYSVSVSAGGASVSCNGDHLTCVDSLHTAVEFVEWHVTQSTLDRIRDRVALHSAGLVLNNEAVLLIGPSGAGKSTLTVELLRRGMDFLSDEAVLLTPDGHAGGFPRGIALADPPRRPDGIVDIGPHSRRRPRLPSGLPKSSGSTALAGKTYYHPSLFGAWIIDRLVPVRHVILLDRRDPELLTPQRRVEALPLLIPHIFANERTEEVFETLVSLVSVADCYQLGSGTPAQAAQAIVDLVRSSDTV